MAQKLKIIPQVIPSETAKAFPISNENFGALPSEEQSYTLTPKQMEVYKDLTLKAQRQKEIDETKHSACITGGAIGGASGAVLGGLAGMGAGGLMAGVPGAAFGTVKGAVVVGAIGAVEGCFAGIGMVDSYHRMEKNTQETYKDSGVKGIFSNITKSVGEFIEILKPTQTPQIPSDKQNKR